MNVNFGPTMTLAAYQQAQATALPQTGSAATNSMTVLGLALAGMLFGGVGLKKQRN
ncbi:LPXTG cell wall anchor domain-containing protein [Lactobacillus sp. 3B(2020)]|uniref:LPXTG cell wall anchor domain-containing protein n=1 Tax=Lactobacillus sp. 3B(2020) TaxID=2695882 RepID=UPI0015E05169|nr:LPXTG cell wall anchor domain-containing protein [Lactobacillus sp. 3B(2020)]QLL69122.1 LPXTG cell wall anchor domain-containing protein [Lactobacillus sp. 3B(2020)]